MAEDFYTLLKQRAQEASRQNGACRQGYADLLRAGDLCRLSRVLDKYWGEVVGKYRESAIRILSDCYPAHRTAINSMGIFFNENTRHGRAIISEGTGFCFGGDARVWMFGESSASFYDNSKASVADKASAFLYDRASAELFQEAACMAYQRSSVKGCGHNRIFIHDGVRATACGECSVYGSRWGSLKLFGNAKLYRK